MVIYLLSTPNNAAESMSQLRAIPASPNENRESALTSDIRLLGRLVLFMV